MTIEELYNDLMKVQNRLGAADWRISLLAAISEMVEALQELPWRPWRTADKRTPSDGEIAKALDELADAFCTIPRICGALGVTAEEFEAACQRHVDRKFQRIDTGIDSEIASKEHDGTTS